MKVSLIVTTYSDPAHARPDKINLHVERGAFALASIVECVEYAGETPFELIVVSNGGAAHDRSLLDLLWKLGRDGRFIANQLNRGVVGTRSIGAAAAICDPIMFLDDDFHYTAGWLDAMMAVWEAHGSERLLLSGMRWPTHTIIRRQLGYVLVDKPVDGCCMMSRALYERAGGYVWPDDGVRAHAFGVKLDKLGDVEYGAVQPCAVRHVYWRRSIWEFAKHPLYDPAIHQRLKEIEMMNTARKGVDR